MQDTLSTIQTLLSFRAAGLNGYCDKVHAVVRLAGITPAIFYVLDLKTRQAVFLNARLGEMLGFPHEPQEPISPEFLLNSMHPNDLPKLNAMLDQIDAADDAAVFETEYRLTHANGMWHRFAARHIVFQRDADGEPLQLLGTAEGISERRQVEQAEFERLYILENAHCLLWDAAVYETSDPHYLHWETHYPALEAAQSFLPLDVKGGNYGTAFYLARFDEDRKNCDERGTASVRAGQSYEQDFRVQSRDGEVRWMHEAVRVETIEAGKQWRVVGVCMDVTERKLLEEQLIESQKLESMGRLAGGIAHDFNNLLTAIVGYTELSQMALPPNAEVRPFLDNVALAAGRAAELTRQLLLYARRQRVEFSNVDINQVILDMHQLLRRTIGEQYELATVLAGDTCCVHANASQMEQVLTNLVVNARDAMPDGGRILIETEAVTLDSDYAERHLGVVPGKYVLYSVSDRGIGMTAEVRARIFEPFYTTKEMGRGTGLGLATCYGIVKQSKGNIWVYSEPDKGTTFKVYLPRVPHETKEPAVKIPDNLPEGTETILLVDDEPMVRDIASQTLRAQGYRVLEASNGAEALHLQSEWKGRIDLLLSDVIMPLMGGKELAQRMRELHPALKVLYMSGYTQNVVLEQGVFDGSMLLLTKPFTSAGLFQKVREALNTPL